jgi:hypothetical protein
LALNGRISPSVKTAYLKLRELNASQRALPDFLIIGAMKAGTTSLFNYLCMHPQIVGSVPKELFYFCSHPERGERWYRRHFPRRTGLAAKSILCGEATPTYLTSERAPARAAATVPGAKIIVLLREPAARAVSHYYHRHRAGRETRSIDEVFSAQAIARIEAGKPQGETEKYLYDRGNYAYGLKAWLNAFPENQILVLEAEQLFRKPVTIYAEVCRFLGIEPVTLKTAENFNANKGNTDKPQRYRELQQAYRQQNRDLAEMDYHFSWMEGESTEQ